MNLRKNHDYYLKERLSSLLYHSLAGNFFHNFLSIPVFVSVKFSIRVLLFLIV